MAPPQKSKPAPPAKTVPPAKNDGQPAPSMHHRPSAFRETVEAIVVAFMLAFLFKTFEAEAFVIPTGSMAPTLMGRHKELKCPQCGYSFTIGASDEVDNENEYLIDGHRIDEATCSNCRYRLPKGQVLNAPVFKGDRILVNKFPYDWSSPDRWDVVVFKYPEEPKVNYIKRCVALPNETIEIRQGDVYLVTPEGTRPLRKDDPNKQRALEIAVYDNDFPEKELIDAGWPERWAAMKKSASPEALAGWSDDSAGWVADAKTRSFRLPVDASSGEPRWIRYRNYVPDSTAWNDTAEGRKPIAPRPELIMDFCGYNAYSAGAIAPEDGTYWVGDLAVHATVKIDQIKPDGRLMLELNEGARAYRCSINLVDGKATLGFAEPRSGTDGGEQTVLATANTELKSAGTYGLSFDNVDDRLCLWIDGKLIDFGDKAAYQPYGGLRIQRPWDEDLVPVGIAASNADVSVAHLVLNRDIYYRNDFRHPGTGNLGDEAGVATIDEYDGDRSTLARRASRPGDWFREYERGLSSNMTGPGQKYEHVSFQFATGPDEFFVMGDNSPRSKDSRLWSNSRKAEHRHAVPRLSLVGKAFFVYWPHGVPFLNDGRGFPNGPNAFLTSTPLARLFYHQERKFDPSTGELGYKLDLDETYPKLRVPFYPNVPRMHRIR